MIKLNNIVLLLGNGEKKVGPSTNDSTDETLNVESKQNILKKLSEFLQNMHLKFLIIYFYNSQDIHW